MSLDTLRAMLSCCDAWEPTVCIMGNVRAGDAAEALRAALAEAEPNPNPWKQAIDDMLVAVESTADSFETPRKALDALIDWHVSVALDPAVSSDAQALIDRGRAEPVTWRDQAADWLRRKASEAEPESATTGWANPAHAMPDRLLILAAELDVESASAPFGAEAEAPPHIVAVTRSLADALKKLVFAARTSGGWKPDAELIAACERAEDALSISGIGKAIDKAEAEKAEPVAWRIKESEAFSTWGYESRKDLAHKAQSLGMQVEPLYLHPPRRELSDELIAVTAERDALRSALNPRGWTRAQSYAWHRALPDTVQAFRALHEASVAAGSEG